MTATDIQQSTGIAAMSPTRMVEMLGGLYATALGHHCPIHRLPAVMLWGMPGVGKSQGVRQLADYLHRATGRTVVVTDVRLLLFNPIDLRGIPTADVDKQFAIWLRPKIFDMSDSAEVINILFLDEISAAPPSVQAAAYQITLDRVIGEHRLPDNCIVMAAGNRLTDKSVVYKMPKALANRLCHIQIEVDFDSWHSWAEANRLDLRVIGFLEARRDMLCTFNASSDDVAFATPRTWEMASTVLLEGGYADPRDAYALLSGLLGVGLANEFCSWCKTHTAIPDLAKVLSGQYPPAPTSPDALYATLRLFAAAAGDCADLAKVRHLIIYSTKFPPDYTAAFFKELLQKGEQVKHQLLQIPEFTRWVGNHAALF